MDRNGLGRLPSKGSEKSEELLGCMGKLDAGLQQLSSKLECKVLPRLDELTEQQDRVAKTWSAQHSHIMTLLESILQERSAINEKFPSEPIPREPMPAKPNYNETCNASRDVLEAPTLLQSVAEEVTQPDMEDANMVKYDDGTDSFDSFLRTADLPVPKASISRTFPLASQSLSKETPEISKSLSPERTPASENVFAQDARLHWRRAIRKEISHRQLPVSRSSQKDIESGWTSMQLFFRSRAYEMISVFLVLLYAVFIGWQVEYFAEYRVIPDWQYHCELAFCIIFTIELVLRLVAEQQHMFHKDRGWNAFDVVVVLTMIVEQIITGASVDKASSILSQIGFVQVLRLIRVVRVLKVIRMGFFRELRMMVYSVLASFKSLTWAMMVQGVLFYIFGISLTQAVVDYLETNNSWGTLQGHDMRQSFGSLGRSTLSLFEGMSGGISWGELLDIMAPLHESYKVIFVCYICIAIFAVTNIVTAVFVEHAMLNAQRDREAVIEEQMETNKAYLKNMKRMFHELDKDNDAVVTIKELRHAVKDERVVAYLNAFGLDITDVHTLFVLLDRDQSGMIDIDEFLLGCMRLKGGASSLDLAKMQYECEWMVHNIETLVVAMEALGTFLQKYGFQPQEPRKSNVQRVRFSE